MDSGSMKFMSVVVFGVASELESGAEKRGALELMMKQHAGGREFGEIPDAKLKITKIYRIDVEHISGAEK